jgi:hypothetical protein
MITDRHPLWPRILVHRACGGVIKNIWNMELLSCLRCHALLANSPVNVEWQEQPMVS